MSFSDYLEQNLNLFPNYHICPVCNESICGIGTGNWPGTCSKKCRGIIQSCKQSGRIGWSRGLTKYDHPGLESMAKKASIRNSGIDPTSKWSDEAKSNSKKKLSEFGRTRIGEKNGMYGKTHTPESIRKIFQKRAINNLEQIIYDFLKNCNIEFYYQYFLTSESTHSYDFKIKGVPLLIEIDGDYWHGGPGCTYPHKDVEQTKANDIIKTQIAEKMGFKLIRFWQSEIESNWDLVSAEILNKIKSLKEK